MGELKLIEEAKQPLAMNPKKFALWLFMVSVGMLFAAWTSAYIVRRGEGEWFIFDLPGLFWINSAVILVSSGTMIWAVMAARKNRQEILKLALGLTTLLGVGFLVGQVFAWSDLIDRKAYFTGGNVSSSFVWVLTSVHAAHLISGLIVLLVMLGKAFGKKIGPKNMTGLEMCAAYWHFLDGLWLYLFIFLLLNR